MQIVPGDVSDAQLILFQLKEDGWPVGEPQGKLFVLVAPSHPVVVVISASGHVLEHEGVWRRGRMGRQTYGLGVKLQSVHQLVLLVHLQAENSAENVCLSAFSIADNVVGTWFPWFLRRWLSTLSLTGKLKSFHCRLAAKPEKKTILDELSVSLQTPTQILTYRKDVKNKFLKCCTKRRQINYRELGIR